MNPVLRLTLLSCVLPVLWLTALPAAAGNEEEDDPCVALCQSLDAVEETCEATYGDGDVFCEAIGAVEETCDPEDGDDDDDATATTTTVPDEGGGDATCTDLCAGISGADELCNEHLGAANAICQGLHDLSGQCDDLAGGNDHQGGDDDDDVCPGDDDDHGAAGGHDNGHAQNAKGKNRKDGGHMVCAPGAGGPGMGLLFGSLLVLGLRRRQA